MIDIWIHSNIARLAEDRIEWHFETNGEVISLGKLLRLVFAHHQHLYFGIIDETGKIRKHINIFLGDTNVRKLSGLETKIEDLASISIFTSVSGG